MKGAAGTGEQPWTRAAWRRTATEGERTRRRTWKWSVRGFPGEGPRSLRVWTHFAAGGTAAAAAEGQSRPRTRTCHAPRRYHSQGDFRVPKKGFSPRSPNVKNFILNGLGVVGVLSPPSRMSGCGAVLLVNVSLSFQRCPRNEIKLLRESWHLC